MLTKYARLFWSLNGKRLLYGYNTCIFFLASRLITYLGNFVLKYLSLYLSIHTSYRTMKFNLLSKPIQWLIKFSFFSLFYSIEGLLKDWYIHPKYRTSCNIPIAEVIVAFMQAMSCSIRNNQDLLEIIYLATNMRLTLINFQTWMVKALACRQWRS
jgi:hypothetical protein